MKEGWFHDDYLILFDPSETAALPSVIHSLSYFLAMKCSVCAVGMISSFVTVRDSRIAYRRFQP